ncbi:hypothetical protein RRG08_010107 [Elysia crispata]|uniref:Uncharacterized protein n=1 Tax=Elysia crispata TaxID=231223 RepID=A0AAE1D766_9GAST|nr:hypothetical protein RRG08_010107 [Elysia crispata]
MSNTQDDSLFARLKRSVPEKDSSNTTPDQKTSGSVSVHDDKKSGGSASTGRSNTSHMYTVEDKTNWTALQKDA